MTSDETARQLGYAALPLILLAIAAFIGWRMGKKRQPPKFVVWPVAVAGALLALGALGMQIRKSADGAPVSETR